jgi:hypothetical protein
MFRCFGSPSIFIPRVRVIVIAAVTGVILVPTAGHDSSHAMDSKGNPPSKNQRSAPLATRPTSAENAGRQRSIQWADQKDQDQNRTRLARRSPSSTVSSPTGRGYPGHDFSNLKMVSRWAEIWGHTFSGDLQATFGNQNISARAYYLASRHSVRFLTKEGDIYEYKSLGEPELRKFAPLEVTESKFDRQGMYIGHIKTEHDPIPLDRIRNLHFKASSNLEAGEREWKGIRKNILDGWSTRGYKTANVARLFESANSSPYGSLSNDPAGWVHVLLDGDVNVPLRFTVHKSTPDQIVLKPAGRPGLSYYMNRQGNLLERTTPAATSFNIHSAQPILVGRLKDMHYKENNKWAAGVGKIAGAAKRT